MKIVVLDKCTVTTGDVDLSPIESCGTVEYYDLLTKPQIIRVLEGADAVIVNKAVIDKEIMDATSLKFIGLFATGYNNIDTDYAKQKGIVVCNVPGYSTSSVTQITFSLMLDLASSTSKYSASVANGDWKRSAQFSYLSYPISELAGKTLGIYGLGAIGISVARVALAFGMKVISYTRTPKVVEGVELVSAERLFRESDFLSFHCPLNKESAKVLNKNTIELMKPTAYVINTSRGGVIDEPALAEALKSGRIAGAGLDVLTAEPMAADCPLADIENCIITPHVAWAAYESRVRLIDIVVQNLCAFAAGEPINVVNK